MDLLLANVPSIICIGFAGALILKNGADSSGWGWFLLLGFLLANIVRSSHG